jgi:serine/threonine protein kinase
MQNPLADRTRVEERLVAARVELESRIRSNQLEGAQDLQDDFPEVWNDTEAALELVYAEYVARLANGESPSRDAFRAKYPAWTDRLDRLFNLYDLISDADTHEELASRTMDPGISQKQPSPKEHAGYQLLHELGRGGMAVVYLARQRDLDRLVALKMMRNGDWLQEADHEDIRREAQAAARLQHPNIVQIYEVGSWDNVPFLSMEYVRGGTLADAIARSHRSVGLPITLEQAAKLIQTLARAMQYAHEQGITHRDLKPANILLSGNPVSTFDEPKIADFGLALTHDLNSSTTSSVTIVGTPSFMSPEQADSHDKAIGPRSDLYALGDVLYELLTGRPPYLGSTVHETLALVRGTEPVSPRSIRPQIPRDLETICLKCLRKDPARRYESASALADDLERYREGRPITARPVSAIEKIWKWCRRRPLLAGLIGSLFIAVAAVIVLLTVTLQRTEKARMTEATLRDEAEVREAKLLLKTARLQWLGHDLSGASATLITCKEAHRDEEWTYLWRACRPPIHELQWSEPMKGRFARSLSFSSDSKSLAVFYTGNILKTWDTAKGTETYDIHAVPNSEGILHPNVGSVVYAFSSITPNPPRKGIKVVESIDLASGSRRRIWTLDQVHSHLLLTPDARFAIYSLTGGNLCAVDLKSASQLFDIKIGIGKPMNLLLSPDGEHVACHTPGQLLSVYDVQSGELKGTLPELRQTYLVAVNHEATRVALRTSRIGQANSLIIRDIDLSRPEIVLSTPFVEIANVRFSPNGRWIAASGREGSLVCVWDAATGNEVLLLRGHSNRVECLNFSPDSRTIAVGCAGGRVAIWDILTNN